MDFSLFYFGAWDRDRSDDQYRLVLESAQIADRLGLAAVWVPERHFHSFGGPYPNPAVLAAAIAAITKRIQIRAGSVVLPLHNPIRVAEEWSMVDRISNGRVELACASGWHADDFVFAPEAYANKRQSMYRAIRSVEQLWAGETIRARNGAGNEIEVRTFPRPCQRRLALWLAASGSDETFEAAGEMGLGVLTHLIGQSIEELARKLDIYRMARARRGFDGQGRVAVMLHTFLTEDPEQARSIARKPFADYLMSSIGLLENLGRGLGQNQLIDQITDRDRLGLAQQAADRYMDHASLIGSPATCKELIVRLDAVGVTEIGCLIDFGVEANLVLDSLVNLDALRSQVARAPSPTLQAPLDPATQMAPRPTHLQVTPTTMTILTADRSCREWLASLECILVGGEALAGPLAKELARIAPGRITNMYGPTEATVWSSTFEVSGGEDVIAIGRPIANTQFFIVDERLEPVPIGVVGELCIGGEGIARGYRNRPSLTAEKFIPDPFSDKPGCRLYRTGDLARYRQDGNVELVGRIDRQVKIRGVRVEPEEIEAVLRTHPSVANVAVTVENSAAGENELIAHVTRRASSAVQQVELVKWLSDKLPKHMIPARIAWLAALPRTPSGKIDRGALQLDHQEPSKLSVDETATTRPQGTRSVEELEKRIAAICAKILGLDQVDVTQNFFALGGHSVAATQLVLTVRAELGIDVSLSEFFQEPTVADLARLASREGTVQDDVADILEQVEAANIGTVRRKTSQLSAGRG